jgi:dethiobiotin synthetase
MRNGVQPVAVKVIQGGAGEMQATMSDDEFAREVSILRSCRDTNILQFQVCAAPR